MSLFSEMWDYVRSKVNSLIGSSISNLKYWVNARISDAISSIRKVYNYFYEYVTNVYNTVEKYITNVYETINKYITNVYETTKKYITNVYNTTNSYITNVVGASREWVDTRFVDMKAYVDSRIALLDPTGFSTDPFAYISGIFSILGLAKETKMIESFLAGFEEGLAEETEG